MNNYKLLILIFFSILCFSCKNPVSDIQNQKIEAEEETEEVNSEWTILIYMNGDNNLEGAAISDLLEIENSVCDTKVIQLFALVDRNTAYDSSNSNWTDTRLYKINTKSKEHEISSEILDCPPLNLGVDHQTELDMSNDFVLEACLSFVMENYKANHYGLVIWGYGAGWRGFSFDETSGTYMSLKNLAMGVESACKKSKNCENKQLDFIAFDTCYGGEIEVAYELRNSCKYLVGCEGLMNYEGWNYKQLLDGFWQGGDYSVESLCKCFVNQHKNNYLDVEHSSIGVFDLSECFNLVLNFNEFCKKTSDLITDLQLHDEVFDVVYSGKDCKTEKYTHGEAGFDIYLDMKSLVENLWDWELQKYPELIVNGDVLNDETEVVSLKNTVDNFNQVYEKFLVYSWANDRKDGGIGVYFQTITDGGYLGLSHPGAYVKGKTANQLDFVCSCNFYVPNAENKKMSKESNENISFLDKLFYFNFLGA